MNTQTLNNQKSGLQQGDRKWSIALSILMILFGIVAIFTPLFTTFATTLYVGWLFIFSGVTRLIHTFRAQGSARGMLLQWLVSITYLVGGAFLLINPLEGAITLTLVLGTMLLFEGAFELLLPFQNRTDGKFNWWLAIDGIITLVLGIFIWAQWPSDASWLIGLYVGVSILSSGVAMLASGIAHHDTAAPQDSVSQGTA